MTLPPPLGTLARTRIDSDYVVVHSEVTILRIYEEMEKLLAEYKNSNQHYAHCPLHEIYEELGKLRAGEYRRVFGQLCNAETPVPSAVLAPLIALLPLKTKDPRYCVRYSVLIAAVHAAIKDMLAADDIVQTPVINAQSYEFIQVSGESEEVDDIFRRMARYVGVSCSTTAVARRLYTNQLSAIRSGTPWGSTIMDLIIVLASRVQIKKLDVDIDKFFSKLHSADARFELAVYDALDILAAYYNGSRNDIYKKAKAVYTRTYNYDLSTYTPYMLNSK